MNSIIKNAETTIHKFGLTRRYKGYRSAIFTMKLFAEAESRILVVTKEIYVEIGIMECQEWKVVKRNVGTVVPIAYNRNPLLMNEIAGCTLTELPVPVSSFLRCLCTLPERLILFRIFVFIFPK